MESPVQTKRTIYGKVGERAPIGVAIFIAMGEKNDDIHNRNCKYLVPDD
jgi:hypothetical protein